MKTPASLSHSTRAFAGILLLATQTGPAALASAVAENYTWSTVTGPAGSELSFYVPSGVAVDASGNLYVAEWYSSTIFRIAPDGTSTTLAAGSWPDFLAPTGLAVDASGNVYVIEIYRVLKINADGAITNLATLWDDPGRIYDYPQGVAVDDAGNVYVTDSTARSIRQIAPDGTVTTVAGTQGRFVYPSGVAVDAAHNVYVADAVACTISKVTPAGVVTTLAGKANEPGSADGPGREARFGFPTSIALDRAGNLYVADTGWEHGTPSSNHTIRKITRDSAVSTIGGAHGMAGFANGAGHVSRFNIPLGLAVDAAGNVFVGEEGNHVIRKGTPPPAVVVGPAHWESRAPSPVPLMYAHACEAADGRIFVTGGQSSGVVSYVYEIYDPSSDSWRQTAVPPLTYLDAVCADNGLVYGVGARTGTPDWFRAIAAYDPQTDSWSMKAHGRRDFFAGVAHAVDGVIYAIGYYLGDSMDFLPAMEAYDPKTDTWKTRPPLTAPSFTDVGQFDHFYSCVARGIIYMHLWDGSLHAYDPKKDAWETSTLPVDFPGVEMIGAVGRLIYFLSPGGVVAYDPQLNTFSIVGPAMPTPRNYAARATVDGRIYVIGGFDPDSWVSELANEFFIPNTSPPVIAQQPLAQTLSATGVLTLSVAVDPAYGPCRFEWRQNGVSLAGATSASLTLPCAQGFHAGAYSVVVTNEIGSTTSATATITVTAPPPSASRLLNVSTRALCRTGDQVLIPGFVIAGTANKQLLLRAVGPTLGLHPFDLEGVLPNPRLALKRWNGTGYEDVSANNDWRDNANVAAIAAATTQVSAFPLIADRDAAMLVDLAPGQYTVVADCADGGSGVAIVELYDADPSTSSGQATNDARLVNLSNRGFAGVGDEVMIPGFVISEEGPKTLLVRVVGPTLADAPYGVANAMADPQLALHRHEDNGTNTLLFTQDNWSESADAAHTAAIAAQVQAFPLATGSKDAAFVVTLSPGVYTVVGSSADGASTGIVLVEVYVVE